MDFYLKQIAFCPVNFGRASEAVQSEFPPVFAFILFDKEMYFTQKKA